MLYAALIGYASLYPFSGWRIQGVDPWSWLLAPWPQYWTAFDVGANFAGYMPLGLLLALGAMRLGWRSGVWWLGLLMPAVLSAAVESTQTYLLARVPSNVDFLLNSGGALVGVLLAVFLDQTGMVRRWTQWRESWFGASAYGSLVLVALWPLALLYPLAVPFGLGQVWDRVAETLGEWWWDTPFMYWLPEQGVSNDPLSPLTEAFCVALGLLAPLLMAFGDLRIWWRRLVFAAAFFLAALGVGGLSGALTYGPTHAWSWATEPVQAGVVVAFCAALVLAFLPRRLCLAIMLMCLGVSLAVLNRAPEVPYFAQSVEIWEQGRFIRFHGLSQWLSWIWPFAAIVYGLGALARSPGRDRLPA
ncbi:VanZ family protein [Hydrogenophaga sp.]|uniref:VanZ family protein n=1 Tax=Hydrogenophaga sp. TaxID=1904254 RepID=UPI00345C187E